MAITVLRKKVKFRIQLFWSSYPFQKQLLSEEKNGRHTDRIRSPDNILPSARARSINCLPLRAIRHSEVRLIVDSHYDQRVKTFLSERKQDCCSLLLHRTSPSEMPGEEEGEEARRGLRAPNRWCQQWQTLLWGHGLSKEYHDIREKQLERPLRKLWGETIKIMLETQMSFLD